MSRNRYLEYLGKKAKICFILAAAFFVLFLICNILVLTCDVQPIGPEGSKVGFAALNGKIAAKFPYNQLIYNTTETIGKLLYAVVAVFVAMGLYQLVTSKSFARVEMNLYALGALYIITLLVYVFYEVVIINYRPVLINGNLEASFPSTHTLMSIVILGSLMFQLAERIESKVILIYAEAVSVLFMGVVVIGRMVSGVHWFTDIVAGGLIGLALVFLYGGAVALINLETEWERSHSRRSSSRRRSAAEGNGQTSEQRRSAAEGNGQTSEQRRSAAKGNGQTSSSSAGNQRTPKTAPKTVLPEPSVITDIVPPTEGSVSEQEAAQQDNAADTEEKTE